MDTQQPTRILIVEDEIITAKAIEKSLQELGYEVIGIASTGEDAFDKAASMRPNLVLMDIKLKGLADGVTTTQRIQIYFGIPVVYLTAHSDDETVRRVMHSQPYGYLVKPFNEKELQDAIERALRQHKMKRKMND
jgi:DNA-binding NarL/FixJ family response regulator